MDKLEIYKQLRDSITPGSEFYALINICVARYEINLIKYNLTRQEKYKIVVGAITKILDQFTMIDFIDAM